MSKSKTALRALQILRGSKSRKTRKVSVAKVHDRKATELPINAVVAPIEVSDPYDQGAKIIVMASLRDDPLARYRAKKMIDDAEYNAGREWQIDYEHAEIGGVGAIDTTKEPVDGRRFPETITDRMRQALKRIQRDDAALGMEGGAIVRDILGKRMTLEQVAAARGYGGREYILYFGRRFRETLDTLAVVRGFSMRSKYATRA